MSENLKLSDGANFNNKGPITGVDFVEFWVSNAKITSKYYCSAFGFVPVSTKLTSNRQSHIVSQKDVTFIFTANTTHQDPEFTSFLQLHGDAIRDVALRVTDIHLVYDRAISHGARSIESPHEIHESNGDVIRIAKIAAPYGNVVHTLVDRTKYKSESFLPKFKVATLPTYSGSPSVSSRGCGLTHIDHVTFAYPQGDMKKAVDWYIDCLGFQQFLCNEEDTNEGLTVEGENSGLRTVILTSSLEPFSFKFVMVEAFKSNSKNQIQEFIECNGNSSGVQHLALHTKDIIVTVDYLRNRGIQFIDVPDSYYESLYKDENVKKSFMKDSYKTLRELGVLLDISFSNEIPKLLMQTFTLPMQDRPTLFLEIICRKGSTGFGSKSIKTLFEAVEKLQQDRNVSD